MGEYVKWSSIVDRRSCGFIYEVNCFRLIIYKDGSEDIYINWCKENTVGKFTAVNAYIIFTDETDAMAFKLYAC